MDKQYIKGYSLVEILMAVAALGIIVLPLLSLFIFGYDCINRAGRKTSAVFHAQDKMEQLKADGFEGLIQQLSGDSYTIPGVMGEEINGFTRHYSLQLDTWEMAGDEGFIITELLLIKVYVKWDEGEREVVFTSYLAPG